MGSDQLFVIILATIAGTALLTWLVALIYFRKKDGDQKMELARLQSELAAAKDREAWSVQAEKQLRDSFESLSSRVLQANSTLFMSQSKEQLKTVLEPLSRDLNKMDLQVKELERNRHGAYKSLINEVHNLKNAHESLRHTTETLSEALKSSSVRGKWGEVQLRRIAELSGMVEHIDFDEQKTTAEGSRPDMIIRLPNEGIIPVDAKVPMTSYMKALEASDPETTRKYLEDHRRALKSHIKTLTQRSYWSQFKVAPELVVLFVPYESGMEASFSQDPGMMDEALANKVIVAGPSSLYGLLKVISYGWLQVRLAHNARDIANQGKELIGRFNTFMGHFSKIGGSLNSSVETFNKAVGSLDSRVLPSMRKLAEMGATQEELPETPQVASRARITEADNTK